MKNNSIRSLIEFIGLDFKKEIIKITCAALIPLLLGGVGYYFLKEIMLLPISLVISLIAIYVFISLYKSKKTSILKQRDEEFINLINYFQSFVTNKNNVYQSFKKLVDYSSSWMKAKLERFLNDIDQDKSVKPYIDFANNFQINIAKNIMLSIYQMVDEGEDNKHLYQFVTLFSQLSEKHLDEQKEAKKKSLSVLSAFPMVGAMMITLLLTFSIISVVGEMVNVL